MPGLSVAANSSPIVVADAISANRDEFAAATADTVDMQRTHSHNGFLVICSKRISFVS